MDRKRCAIYTRKSHEEGLEQDYNSLDAQTDAAESYIISQAGSGWVALKKEYSDGGFTGANTERPGLQSLIKDIKAGKVDIVVVYKIDRLSRSLLDFADLFTLFDKYNVNFVSVTQQIDTSSPAGRMMLNILMTFAQYEREVIAERIRDKFESSRKRGIWMGGTVPYGYMVKDRKLLINEPEARIVKEIFDRYAHTPAPRVLALDFNARGIPYRRNKTWDSARVARIIKNRTYCGLALYKGNEFPGEHEAIISTEVWEKANKRTRDNGAGGKKYWGSCAPFKGILKCGNCGAALTPSYSTSPSKKRRYRYYSCSNSLKGRTSGCKRNISGKLLEELVIQQLAKVFKSEMFYKLFAEVGGPANTEYPVFKDLPEFWKSLFPFDRTRMMQLLLKEIVIDDTGFNMTVDTQGLKEFITEIINYDNDNK